MKKESFLVPISAILIYWTFTGMTLVGCYSSYSVGIKEGDDGGTDPLEHDGGDDNIETPVDDGGDRGTDPPEHNGGDDNIETPVDGDRGTDPPEYDGGDDAIETPVADSKDGEFDFSRELKSDIVQLSESEWTESTFSDRYDRRWFKIDVIVGNLYHVFIDDEFGSGLHYADEEIYVYEGEPSDLREYFDYVDVYYDTDDDHDRGGFFDKPYEYKANFTGELHILLESDNPGYQTFEIRYEIVPPVI